MNYYQPFLLPFLSSRPYRLPRGVSRRYFVSFEDALWELLRHLAIPAGSRILIPDFYCTDVVNNIKDHGYVPVFYPLDDSFQTGTPEFLRIVKRHNPRIIIVFHAAGISSLLRSDATAMEIILKRAIVIEDCVHRLLNPGTVEIVHPNHFAIDSLRKVTPLPGSFLYGRRETIESLPQTGIPHPFYAFASYVLYAAFRTAYALGISLDSARVVIFAHKTLLRYHDALIGNSRRGNRGLPIVPLIHRFMDFGKIERIKRLQAEEYESLLAPLFARTPIWYRIRIPVRDRPLLHVYPVGIRLPAPDVCAGLESYLEKLGLPVWIKFPDSAWSTRRAVLFLPLGPHVAYNDRVRLVRALSEYRFPYEKTTAKKRSQNSLHPRRIRKNQSRTRKASGRASGRG